MGGGGGRRGEFQRVLSIRAGITSFLALQKNVSFFLEGLRDVIHWFCVHVYGSTHHPMWQSCLPCETYFMCLCGNRKVFAMYFKHIIAQYR